MAEQEIGKKGKTYGLLLPKKGQNKVKVKSVFGDDSDNESAHDAINTSIKQEAQKSKIKRQTQLEIDRALEADPTVYEYDSIYDSMQEKKAQQAAAISSDKSNVEKKAKYIGGLLKASEVRKREFERQQERKVQKERETEGDEFAEKEVFVTGAYRKKMQEMQEAEEEERRQSQLEAMLDVKKQKDMTGFYRYLLNEKTGENIKTENEKPEVSVKTEEEKTSEKPEDSENTDNSLPKIKKEQMIQRENKERKQYRRRKSSSSSSSRSRSPENRTRSSPRQQKKASLDSSDDSEDDKNTKVSSKEQDKSSRKDSRSISNKQKDSSELDKNRAEKTTHNKKDKRKQRTRSSSRSSSSDDDGPSVAKKDKSEERKEVKKETKVDKELTIEEIKARYARRTTKDMIEAARDRYFLRKIERDQTKPYIFRSDE
ncbi:nuclear speckle splicing regulatory protein 1-like [Mytilus californianus]|uniref:nuclear speckle splicing regulatory protein 1-like n=1 Tax=Mytilus californianus TaxID=6549 RepID=UPI002247EF5C|nr:nuclear speckle splicing regulatory protein 1-like [Mytilus californianus]